MLQKITNLPDGEGKNRIIAEVVDIARQHGLDKTDKYITKAAAALRIQSLINKYPEVDALLSREEGNAIRK